MFLTIIGALITVAVILSCAFLAVCLFARYKELDESFTTMKDSLIKLQDEVSIYKNLLAQMVADGVVDPRILKRRPDKSYRYMSDFRPTDLSALILAASNRRKPGPRTPN